MDPWHAPMTLTHILGILSLFTCLLSVWWTALLVSLVIFATSGSFVVTMAGSAMAPLHNLDFAAFLLWSIFEQTFFACGWPAGCRSYGLFRHWGDWKRMWWNKVWRSPLFYCNAINANSDVSFSHHGPSYLSRWCVVHMSWILVAIRHDVKLSKTVLWICLMFFDIKILCSHLTSGHATNGNWVEWISLTSYSS